MKQYEIWWTELARPAGRRPVLLLSRNDAYRYLSWVIVAEITSTVRGIPVEVRLGRTEGLDRTSVANFDNIHVVRKAALSARLGSLAGHRVEEVKRAFGAALDWEELRLQP